MEDMTAEDAKRKADKSAAQRNKFISPLSPSLDTGQKWNIRQVWYGVRKDERGHIVCASCGERNFRCVVNLSREHGYSQGFLCEKCGNHIWIDGDIK